VSDACWVVASVAAALFMTTSYFAAITSEYRFRFGLLCTQMADLVRETRKLKGIILSDQEHLNADVAQALSDLSTIKERLLQSPSGVSLDFSGLDNLVQQLDAAAKVPAPAVDPAAPAAPVTEPSAPAPVDPAVIPAVVNPVPQQVDPTVPVDGTTGA